MVAEMRVEQFSHCCLFLTDGRQFIDNDVEGLGHVLGEPVRNGLHFLGNLFDLIAADSSIEPYRNEGGDQPTRTYDIEEHVFHRGYPIP